ncbi:MAG: hypothetical protein WDZ28_01415 [Simkaniaceae bacterium]
MMNEMTFDKEGDEKRSLLLLGPLFVIALLAMGLVKGVSFNTTFFLLTLLGLIASLFYEVKGALIASCLTLASFFLFKFQLPKGSHVWYFGYFSSLSISFFLTGMIQSIRVREVEDKVEEPDFSGELKQARERVKKAQEKSQSMEELLKASDRETQKLFDEVEELKKDSLFQRRLIEDLKLERNETSQPSLSKEKAALFEDIKNQNIQLERLLKDKENELHSLKHEVKLLSSRQMQLLEEDLSKENLLKIEKERDSLSLAFKALENEVENLQEKIAKTPPDIKVLRQQFNDKKKVLDTTRAQLFQQESDLFAYRKILKEKEMASSKEEEVLVQDLKSTEEECLRLEEENHLLGSLVSQLIEDSTISKG